MFSLPDRYERNIMIFDWLHTLDESATATAEAAVEKDSEKEEK
jgi:hypothetical protein